MQLALKKNTRLKNPPLITYTATALLRPPAPHHVRTGWWCIQLSVKQCAAVCVMSNQGYTRWTIPAVNMTTL